MQKMRELHLSCTTKGGKFGLLKALKLGVKDVNAGNIY
jgi:hypothetical protein